MGFGGEIDHDIEVLGGKQLIHRANGRQIGFDKI
jgi:hypothetical protein